MIEEVRAALAEYDEAYKEEIAVGFPTSRFGNIERKIGDADTCVSWLRSLLASHDRLARENEALFKALKTIRFGRPLSIQDCKMIDDVLGVKNEAAKS